MESKDIKKIIIERNPEAKFLEKEFDEAIIGSAVQCGSKYVALYDSNKCIEILMKELEFGEMEAYEQYQYTVESIKYSKNNPIVSSNFQNAKLPDLPDLPEINEYTTLEDIF